MGVSRLAKVLGWSISLAIHVGAVAWLLTIPRHARANRRQSLVSFSVTATPQAAVPAPHSTPAASPPVPRSRRHTAAVPSASRAAKTTGIRAPVDLTGVTLSGDDGASWASITGNGKPMVEPIRAAVTAPTPTQIQGSAAEAALTELPKVAPAVVALRDLSNKPVPPSLDLQLLNNYPASAKRQGLAGKASVTAQIDADGVVRSVRVLSESGTGFGAACQKTLQGSKWSAPRDRQGNAVPTQIHYTCDFRVDG